MAMPALSPAMYTPPTGTTPDGAGGALVGLDGRALPLRGTTLRARAKGGLARTVVRQTFVNPYAEALEVTYRLPLPVDGAVSGFRFVLDGVEVVGEVDRKQRARERYEQALVEGRTAALLEQERPNLFTQRVGNIPPRSTVVCEVTVDQRLTWLDEGAWEWRFPTVVGARYLGEAGRVPDADRVRVEVADAPLPHRLALELTVADAIVDGYRPESPSHPLDVVDENVEGDPSLWGYRTAPLRTRDPGAVAVGFRDREGVRLDRDVVVRWPVSEPTPGLALDVETAPEGSADAGARYGLLTVVPPTATAKMRALPRDLIFLIDTSGSMGGQPLEQAARVASAMIDTLTERDRIELIEFSSSPRRWRMSPVYATEAHRAEAIAWVRALQAGGSTEMRAALLEALKPLRAGAQRQVVLITDGYIGFEREIVETVYQKLPLGCRLHTLGVGSSVNRALTAPAAQAGRGVEQVVGIDEDAERAARRLVERTHAPLVTELTVEGDGVEICAPARLPDLFAASPVLLSLKLGKPGTTFRVRGLTDRGTWEQTLRVPERAASDGGAVRARFARDRVEDCELLLAAGGVAREVDAEIEKLGVVYQIATRLTSWVAVSHARTVSRTTPRRSESMPHELPHGVSAEGMGLRHAVTAVEKKFEHAADVDDESNAFADITGAFAAAPLREEAPSATRAPTMLRAKMAAPSLAQAPVSYSVQGPPPPSPSMSYGAPMASPSYDPSAPMASVPQARRSRASVWIALLLFALLLAVAGVLVYRALTPDVAPNPPPTHAPHAAPTSPSVH